MLYVLFHLAFSACAFLASFVAFRHLWQKELPPEFYIRVYTILALIGLVNAGLKGIIKVLNRL